LGREYGPDVWSGDDNSMCDIRRQLTKFHTTPYLPSNVTPYHKMATKAWSYYCTDSNTPIIGEIARLIVDNYPDLIVDVEGSPELRRSLTNYFSFHPMDVQFPNVAASWMDDVVRRDIPTWDNRKFHTWLQLAKSKRELLLCPPLCATDDVDVKVPAPVVVNGEIVEPAVVAEKPKEGGECKFFLKGHCKKGMSCNYKHTKPKEGAAGAAGH
jgi:hypothetical protein